MINQIKNTLKKKRNVENYQQLEKNIDKAIEKVKPGNYKNYFEYAYNLKEGMELQRKVSTRKRKIKKFFVYYLLMRLKSELHKHLLSSHFNLSCLLKAI